MRTGIQTVEQRPAHASGRGLAGRDSDPGGGWQLRRAATCSERAPASSFLIVNALERRARSRARQVRRHAARPTCSPSSTTCRRSSTTSGRCDLSLAMKDPRDRVADGADDGELHHGRRYHVTFIRSDGRNNPGVDVPYAFDGGFTTTVGGDEPTARSRIVRNIAKQEAPLRALDGPTASSSRPSPRSRSTGTTRPAARSARLGDASRVDFGNFGTRPRVSARRPASNSGGYSHDIDEPCRMAAVAAALTLGAAAR